MKQSNDNTFLWGSPHWYSKLKMFISLNIGQKRQI